MDDTTESGHRGAASPGTSFEPLSPADVAELVLGTAVVGAETARRAFERLWPAVLATEVVTAPLTSALDRWSAQLRASVLSQSLIQHGRSQRDELGRRVEVTARRVAAAVLESVLDLVDLTDVVLDHVDLDAVVHAVDLDRAIARVDVDAVVRRVDIGAILDRVDVDAVVARADLDRAVARVDIGAILDRVDVDAVVARADLDRAVARVDIGAILDRVDVDAVVARADLDRAVARVDIGAILDRVDVDAIATRLDLDAVVARLDLIELAEFVVEGIDLPGIIQSSSGAMASEGMREVRWQGVGADERVAHVVDRMLRRRPRTPGPALPVPEITPGPVLPGTTA